MKKYPKLIQIDARGQLVIPKEIRRELGLDEGTGFWAYMIDKEGIFLKKIDSKALKDHPEIDVLKEKAAALNVKKENVEKAEARYEKKKKGAFEEL